MGRAILPCERRDLRRKFSKQQIGGPNRIIYTQTPATALRLIGCPLPITPFPIPIIVETPLLSSDLFSIVELLPTPIIFPYRNFDILMAGGSMRNIIPNRLNVIEPSTSIFQLPKVVFLAILSVLAMISLVGIACNAQSSFASNDELSDQIYSIEVVNEFHHDPAAFTQGLLYGGNNTLFESTGLNGHSSVRKVDLQTAKIEALHKMDDSYFGEGLTLLGERLYQLTWLTKTGFMYDRQNLSKFERFSHHMNDGWGFATDGKILFGSDGSSSLYHIHPQTMKVIAQQVIRYKDHEVHNLNELEYINNEVWANIWQTDCIVRISPLDGTVTGWILLPELREGLIAAGYNVDVLNGIAWDVDNKRLFVTGKLWPKLYEIKLHPWRKPLPLPIEKICLDVKL